MKKTLSRMIAILLTISTLAGFAPAAALSKEMPAELVSLVDLPEELLQGEYFYLANASTSLDEDAGAAYLFTVGRGGNAQESAEITVLFRDFTALYGENYTACEYGGREAVVPDGHISYVEILSDADSYEEYPLLSEEEAEEYLLNAADEVESYLTEQMSENETAKEDGSAAAVTGAYAGNPLAEAHAEAAGHSLNRIPVSEGSGAVMVNTETGESSGGETDVDPESLTNSFVADDKAESELSANDTDNAIPPAKLTLSFAPGELTKRIAVTPLDSAEAEGDAMFMMALSSPSEGMALASHNSIMVTINDTDEVLPAQLSFAETALYVEGDSAFLTIQRSGAMNRTVSAQIFTEEQDAVGYADFSPLGARLVFPFGVKSRTVEIPVNHIRDTETSFRVVLSPETDCAITEGAETATVTISPYQEETAAVMLQGATGSGDGGSTTPAADSSSAVDLSKVSIIGSGYYSGDGFVSLTTHGIDCGVTSGILFDRSNDVTWRSYAYDGYLIRWRMDTGYFWPDYEVSLEGRETNGSDSRSKLFRFTDEDDDDYAYIDEMEDKFCWTPVYFGKPSVYDTKLGMVTTWGRGNDLDIGSVTPIRREFHVELLPAEARTFKNVSSVEASGYTAAAMSDQKVSSKGQIYSVKYVGDSVSITATDANHFLTLSGAELCREDGSVVAFLPSGNTASDTFTLELTKDFIDQYGAEFSYEENTEVYTQSRAGKACALIGRIYLRPRFEYRDVALTIQADADGRGSFAEFPATGAQSGWHMGDVVKLSGAVKQAYAASADVTAYAFTIQKNVQTEPVSGSILFNSTGSASLQLSAESVSLRPMTTERSNALVVTVAKADYDRLDHEQGIFAAGSEAIHYNAAAQQYEITVVPAGSLANGALCSLVAVPAMDNSACVWTEFGSDRVFCGNAFYHTAGSKATENVVHLSVSETGTTSRSLAGYLYYANVNINTDRSAAAAFPATGQVLGVAGASAMADETGYFETGTFCALPGTWVRYLTASNGNVHLGDVYVPEGSGAISVGMITVPAQSSAGAAVDRVSVEQSGFYLVQTIPMGGVRTIMRAAVKDHVPYVLENETLTENITAVNFIVLDGKTMEQKAVFIAQKDEDYEDDPVWVADAGMLTPDNSTDYNAGDYLYVELVTDRRLAGYEGAGEDVTEVLSGVVYSPQYSGFTFVSTESYEPVMMEIAIPVTAENILTGNFKSYFSAEESATKRKFVTLPFIGGLDTQISPARTTKNNLNYNPGAEFNYDPDEGYGGKSATSYQKPAVNLTITVEARPNGVTRLKIGAAITFMNSKEETISQNRSGKFESITNGIANLFNGGKTPQKKIPGAPEMIYEDQTRSMLKNRNYLQSNYGGVSMSFSIMAGFYVDFGLVAEDDGEDSALDSIGAHFVLIGLGGYYGFSGSIGYTLYFIIPIALLPGYIGFTGTLAVMGSMGASGDPANALNYDEQDVSFVVNDFCDEFMATINGILSFTGFVGIGIRGVVGVRGTATLTFSVGMDSTYPDMYQDCPWWGLDISLTLGMVIDFTIFSIPFTLTGWNFLQRGFYEYFAKQENGVSLLGAGGGGSDVLGYGYKARTGGSDFTGGVSDRPRLQATFAPDAYTVDTVIAENIYSQPDTKLLALEDGKMLMAFLDDDPSKADDQITSLYISLYDGSTWSEPQKVQNDNTGDFSPNLTDCGERVLISWVSAPDCSAETDIDRLMDLEVYTAFFDKTAETVSTPERLTDDVFFDSQPIGVYDEASDSIALYYTKNAPEMEQDAQGEWHVSPDVSLLDVTNGLNAVTYSQICYRLFEDGEWITKYYESEYPQGVAGNVLNAGERYLNTEVTVETPSGINNDPVVTDFCAAPGYNGLAVFAYTVDMDNDFETEDDRELYLQVYNFEEHKLYHPTRLTNNDCADAQPQLVRGDGATRLFWLAGDQSIAYVNVTDILRYGLNEDGSLKTVEEARAAASEEDPDFDMLYHKIDLRQKRISDETDSAVTDFVALTDNDGNMYVLWGNGDYSAPAEAEDTEISVTREIYGVGMVKSEAGTAWSEPVKLTDSRCVNDCIAAAVDSNDRLMIAANRYTLSYDTAADAGEEPMSISAMQLVTVSLAHMGSVEVTEIELSDDTPLPGDELTVTVTVKNTGLTTATGFSLQISEGDEADETGTAIGSISDDEPLLPGGERSFLFSWTVPQAFEGVTLTATARENGFTNDFSLSTDPLKAVAVYSLERLEGYQSGDDFYVDYTVSNHGNAASAAGDEIRMTFVNLYGHSGEDFGFAPGSDEIVARSGSLALSPGETKTGTLVLSLPEKAFDLYGYVDLTGCVFSVAGEKRSLTEEIYVTQTAPTDLTIGDQKRMIVNGTAKLCVSYDAGRLDVPAKIVYTVGDSTLAAVNGDTIVALGDGETTLTATLVPYGTSVTVPLITGTSVPPAADSETFPFVDVKKTDYCFDPVRWAVKNGITDGADATHFSPNGLATRGEIVTFLYRAYLNLENGKKVAPNAVCPFTDVKPADFYYEAVLWASANGITKGTSDTTFSPNAYATRAQTATFLYRFYKAYGQENAAAGNACPFTDVKNGDYFCEAVLWAFANSITNGTSDTTFSPQADVTRGQTVTFLHRYFENLNTNL